MSLEFRVGALFLVAVIALGFMVSFLTQKGSSFRANQTYYAWVDDSSGILRGASIQVAGIPVGRLEDKVLMKGRAKLILKLSKEIVVYSDAQITIRTIGYFGDRYLDLDLGTPDSFPMGEGSFIATVNSPSFGDVIQQADRLLDEWARVATSLRSLLGS